MRQKLIDKTKPQAKDAFGNTIVADAISLQSLLLDSKISKKDWLEGLKYHCKTLTHLLLNKKMEEFDD